MTTSMRMSTMLLEPISPQRVLFAYDVQSAVTWTTFSNFKDTNPHTLTRAYMVTNSGCVRCWYTVWKCQTSCCNILWTVNMQHLQTVWVHVPHSVRVHCKHCKMDCVRKCSYRRSASALLCVLVVCSYDCIWKIWRLDRPDRLHLRVIQVWVAVV